MAIQYFAILGLCIASLIFETGENHCEWFSLHDKGQQFVVQISLVGTVMAIARDKGEIAPVHLQGR